MNTNQNFSLCYKTNFSLTYFEKALLLFLLILVVSCSERKKNSLETSKLKGAIKSITASTHDAYEAFGEPKYKNSIMAFSLVWKSVYNRDGNLMESNAYDPTGFYGPDSIISKTKFKYDMKGNEIESRTYDNSGELTTIWNFNYDEKGNLSGSSNCEYASKDISSFGTKTIDLCDNKGKITRSEIQECDGKPIMTYEYQYDEKGNTIQEELTMSDGESSITTFKYDGKNNLIEEVSKSGTFTYKYEFDAIGNWVKRYKYKGDTVQIVLIHEIEYYN